MYDLQGFSCLCLLVPWFPVDLTPVSLVVCSVMSRAGLFHQMCAVGRGKGLVQVGQVMVLMGE